MCVFGKGGGGGGGGREREMVLCQCKCVNTWNGQRNGLGLCSDVRTFDL